MTDAAETREVKMLEPRSHSDVLRTMLAELPFYAHEEAALVAAIAALSVHDDARVDAQRNS